MNENQKRQIEYQKTEFNKARICMLSNIIKCKKCKRNNTIQQTNLIYQNCFFCGNTTYIKK